MEGTPLTEALECLAQRANGLAEELRAAPAGASRGDGQVVGSLVTELARAFLALRGSPRAAQNPTLHRLRVELQEALLALTRVLVRAGCLPGDPGRAAGFETRLRTTAAEAEGLAQRVEQAGTGQGR